MNHKSDYSNWSTKFDVLKEIKTLCSFAYDKEVMFLYRNLVVLIL